MSETYSLADATLLERLRNGLGRRATGLALAIALELLLILLLFTLGQSRKPEVAAGEKLATFDVGPEPSATPDQPKQQPSQKQPTPHPSAAPTTPPSPVPAPQPTVAPPEPVPTHAAIIPIKPGQMQQFDISGPPRPPAPPADNAPAYGPAFTGTQSDSQRVGTAPNGQPMYAASWYRKPYEGELKGYLSTAQHPGWGIIACQTAPDYRVENCQVVDEWPDNSHYAEAVLAAAWQFKVRPPRIGGRSVIGAWVRIKIYDDTGKDGYGAY